jgi:Ca2+-binding RTX toxin-like protein
MTIRISLSGKKGVNFNKGYEAFFEDFAPNGSPEFLGPDASETTQIAHIATPEPGKEAQARAVLLNGEDFFYTFANHTVSGEIDSISLVRLGKAYDKDTGDLVLEDGVIKDATPYITFSNLDIENEAGVAGPVHAIVAGMMGGGPSGTMADPSAITDAVWGEAHNVRGSSGGDKYLGTKFDDVVRGLKGNDVLKGRGGDDKIAGGLGADKMVGGAGADTFIFGSVREARRDVIRDFDVADGDQIKLTGIDADTGVNGSQDFAFIGGERFSGDAGELRFRSGDDKTGVSGDTDGDGSAALGIVLFGEVARGEDSFLL